MTRAHDTGRKIRIQPHLAVGRARTTDAASGGAARLRCELCLQLFEAQCSFRHAAYNARSEAPSPHKDFHHIYAVRRNAGLTSAFRQTPIDPCTSKSPTRACAIVVQNSPSACIDVLDRRAEAWLRSGGRVIGRQGEGNALPAETLSLSDTISSSLRSRSGGVAAVMATFSVGERRASAGVVVTCSSAARFCFKPFHRNFLWLEFHSPGGFGRDVESRSATR